MIYAICFLVSVFFAALAKMCRSKYSFWFFSFLSILVTALLAGLRDLSIGIDTMNYYTSEMYWQGACSSSSLLEYFRNYLVLTKKTIPEILFVLMVGVVQKTTGRYFVLLFVEHLFIVGCVYAGAYRLKEHVNPILVLFSFYFLYYGQTLNITRQYMAMALIFLAVKDLEEGKNKRFLAIVIAAMLIHNSAVCGLVIFVIFRVLYTKKRFQGTSPFRRMLLGGGIILGAQCALPLIRLAIRLGILDIQYQWFIDTATPETNYFVLIFYAIEIMGIVLCLKYYRKDNPYADFYVLCFVAYVALNSVGSIIHYGDRVSEYFSLINLVTFGALAKCQKSATNRFVFNTAIVLCVGVYWLFVYLIHNSSETMPYILGIV